jgi:hypothetical protein
MSAQWTGCETFLRSRVFRQLQFTVVENRPRRVSRRSGTGLLLGDLPLIEKESQWLPSRYHSKVGNDKGVFYEQVTGVKGLLLSFSFILLLLLLLVSLRRMLLSTGFL